MKYIVYIFPTIIIFGTLVFFHWYLNSLWRSKAPVKKRTGKPQRLKNPVDNMDSFFSRYPMERKDVLPLIIITIIYAVVAFSNLGDIKAPQTFLKFDEENPSITIDLGAEVMLDRVFYYTGLWAGDYNLEFSQDLNQFQVQPVMEQSYASLFKWQDAGFLEKPTAVRYIRLTSNSPELELGELAFYDSGGSMLSPDIISYDRQDGIRLFDEQNLVPAASSYMNSAYFDEIYHARTAYEHLRGIYPYEISHPPLGKLIIMQGIRLFGMTPFGYRCMGVLFGVFMLPAIYILIKNMFGKSEVAFLGTVLFAFDFMHYVQTRISTIDVYGVFFILLMYLFMFRYITVSYEKPIKSQLPELFLCGLSFGLGAAAKWISIYAALGLIALYVMNLVMRTRYYLRKSHSKREMADEAYKYLGNTILYSVLFFVIIPIVIYSASYYPYFLTNGKEATLGNLLSEVWSNQKYMFNYHEGVRDTHPYSSQWWMWIVDARPILYYLTQPETGMKSSFGAFNNPLISWGGILAMIILCFRVRRNKNKGVIWFIIIGYLSQLLPWVPIKRVTFAYHYFPSTVFLVLALCFVYNELYELKPQGYKRNIYVFTGVSAALFILFYPVLSGITAPDWYFATFLKWFPSWPF